MQVKLQSEFVTNWLKQNRGNVGNEVIYGDGKVLGNSVLISNLVFVSRTERGFDLKKIDPDTDTMEIMSLTPDAMSRLVLAFKGGTLRA